MTVILSYLFYFVAASASPLQRRWLAVHRNNANDGQVSLAFYVSLIVACGSFALPFFSPFELSGNVTKLVLLGLVCGIFGAGYFITSYIAQKHVEAGVSSIVSNIYTPVTILLGSFFLKESLTLTQTLGTVLLLIGMVVVSQKHKVGRFSFDKYFWLMFLSGILLAILLVAERALQIETGFTAGTTISWWSQCLALGLVTLVTKNKNVYAPVDIAITGVLKFFQALSWVTLIYVVGNISVVSAVTTFKVVVIFAAAALFLGERDDWKRKLLGSIVALVGLLLMK